jgi:hypothetical protein
MSERNVQKSKLSVRSDGDNDSIKLNSLFIYLRADSTAIGHLQSQHGHMKQKEWTAQRQHTKTSGLYRQVLNVYLKSKLR